MKVLFTITYFQPYISGLTIAAARFAQGLVDNGYDVTVFAMQHDPHLSQSETIDRIRIRRAPWVFKISKSFVSFAWWTWSWRLVKEHDVVVVNLPQFEGIIPAVCAKLFKKKLIVIYHCEVVLPKGIVNSVVQLILEISHRATLMLADRIVAYTGDYARSSELLQPVLSKVSFVVPPIPMPKRTLSVTNQLKKRIGNATPVIGVSARLAAEKGIEYLLEAIPVIMSSRVLRGDPDGPSAGKAGIASSKTSRNDRIKVVIAGPMDPVGEESYKKIIMKLVKQYKKYVEFLGEIAPEDMGSFYRLIDVLVLPSVNRTEAFGLVQIEAMLCGVPVVASNLPGVRVPITKTGMGILVPPRDTTAVAEAISAVLADKKSYVRSPEVIQKYFSPEKSIEEFIQLL